MDIITEYVKSRVRYNKQTASSFAVAVATMLLTAFVMFFAIGIYTMQHSYGWSGTDVIRLLKQSSLSIAFLIVLFVFLLYNLFTISFQKRLKELGILKSLGASSRDIKKMLRLDALFGSFLPVITGMLLGTVLAFFITKLVHYYNTSAADFKNLDGTAASFKVEFKFNPAVYILIFILAELTVLFSVFLPAKKAARRSPMQLLLEQIEVKKKKLRLAGTYKKELFKNHKKYFTPVSRIIAAGYVILTFFLSVLSSMHLTNEYTYTTSSYNFNIRILNDNKSIDFIDIFKIKNIDGINKIQRHTEVRASINIPDSAFSNEFKINTTGKALRYFNKRYKKNNMYRLKAVCFGIEQDVYNSFLKKAGLSGSTEAFIVNSIKKDTYEPNHNPKTIPFFNNSLTSVDFFVPAEKEAGGMQKIPAALVSEIPAGIEIDLYRYQPYNFTPVIVFPIKTLETLYDSLLKKNAENYTASYFFFDLADKTFSETTDKITQVLKESGYADNVKIYNRLIENKENINDTYKFTAILFVIMCIIFLLCIINAYSAITAGMWQRKKEIAIAVSLGLSQKKLKRLFMTEALLHCIIPLLKAFPFCALVAYWYSSRWILFSFDTLLLNINYIFMIAFICIIWPAVFMIYFSNIKNYNKKKPIDLIIQAI